MANKTVTDIREAVEAVLTQIKESDGYSLTVDASHIYAFDSAAMRSKEDRFYPKFCVLLDSGSKNRQPGNRSMDTLMVHIIVIVKKVRVEDPSSTEMIEKVIEDIDRVFMLNDTLNNTAIDVELTDFDTDTGAVSPEGAAVFELKVTYEKRM